MPPGHGCGLFDFLSMCSGSGPAMACIASERMDTRMPSLPAWIKRLLCIALVCSKAREAPLRLQTVSLKEDGESEFRSYAMRGVDWGLLRDDREEKAAEDC